MLKKFEYGKNLDFKYLEGLLGKTSKYSKERLMKEGLSYFLEILRERKKEKIFEELNELLIKIGFSENDKYICEKRRLFSLNQINTTCVNFEENQKLGKYLLITTRDDFSYQEKKLSIKNKTPENFYQRNCSWEEGMFKSIETIMEKGNYLKKVDYKNRFFELNIKGDFLINDLILTSEFDELIRDYMKREILTIETLLTLLHTTLNPAYEFDSGTLKIIVDELISEYEYKDNSWILAPSQTILKRKKDTY